MIDVGRFESKLLLEGGMPRLLLFRYAADAVYDYFAVDCFPFEVGKLRFLLLLVTEVHDVKVMGNAEVLIYLRRLDGKH